MQEAAAEARFAIVLVNYNGAETLVKAVTSAVGEGVAEPAIVVVDNGSVDRSLEQLSSAAPGAVVLRNGCNAGFARAANRGLRAAKGEFLLLLNNDAELMPGALQAFEQAFDTNPRLAIAGGQLRYPDGRLQSAFAALPTLLGEIVPMGILKWLRPERYRRSTEEGATRMVESAFGACLAVRASALSDIGLLDEDFFFYFEEVEWCRRARLRGWDVAYVAGARAVHVLGHTAHRFRADARVEMQRSKLLYFRKCASPAVYVIVSAWLVVRTALNAISGSLLCVLTLFQRRRSLEKTRGYWHMLRWHLLGRPQSWGLPGKCPDRGGATQTAEG